MCCPLHPKREVVTEPWFWTTQVLISMSRGLVQLEQRKSSKRVGLVIVLISFCGHYVVYIYINDCRYQVSLPHLLSYSDLFRTVKAWNPRWLWWRCSPAGGWEALHCGVWQVRAGTLLTNMTSSWKWNEPIIESFQVLGEIFTEVTSYFRVLSWLPRTLKRFWKTLSIPPHGAKSRLKLDFISNIPVKVAKKIPNIQWGSIGRAKGSEDRSMQGGLLQVA